MEAGDTRRRLLATVATASAFGSSATPKQDICQLSLREVTQMLRTRQLSAREVMRAPLDQIHRWNPQLNAIVAKLDDEACMALADAADGRAALGAPAGQDSHDDGRSGSGRASKGRDEAMRRGRCILSQQQHSRDSGSCSMSSASAGPGTHEDDAGAG